MVNTPSLQAHEAHKSSRTYLDQIRRTPGPFTEEDYDTSDENLARLASMSVLYVDFSFDLNPSSHFTESLERVVLAARS